MTIYFLANCIVTIAIDFSRRGYRQNPLPEQLQTPTVITQVYFVVYEHILSLFSVLYSIHDMCD